MSLQSWLQNSWLVQHPTSAEEIADLLRISDRDLAACQVAGLPTDWRLTIAYNAGLQAATAALASAGYRATRESSLPRHPVPRVHPRARQKSDRHLRRLSQEAERQQLRCGRESVGKGSGRNAQTCCQPSRGSREMDLRDSPGTAQEVVARVGKLDAAHASQREKRPHFSQRRREMGHPGQFRSRFAYSSVLTVGGRRRR
jgi:hypothetical protein